MTDHLHIEAEVDVNDVPDALKVTRIGSSRLVGRFTTDMANFARNVARNRAPKRGDERRRGGPTTIGSNREVYPSEAPGNLARSIIVPVPARQFGDSWRAIVTHDEISAPYFRYVHEGTGPKIVPFSDELGFRNMRFPETRRGYPHRFWAGNFFRGQRAQPYMDEAVAATESTILPFRGARLVQDIVRIYEAYVPRRPRKG